ncbi:hypothetical protein OPQ81_005627 [Rhizoctonia solani]|nr:hypothetical protein OPQ81_005627 [Rhizoctonia solani]
MTSAADRIAGSIIAGINDEQELDEDAIMSLHRIFPHTFLRALDLIDRGKIVQLTYQGRDFIQVTGSDQTYDVYLNLVDLRTDPKVEGGSIGIIGLDSKAATTWCSCEAFLTRTLVPVEEQTCEHILALLLAIRLGRLPRRICDNHEISLSFLVGPEVTSQRSSNGSASYKDITGMIY